MADFETKIGLDTHTRDTMIALLNQQLADTSDLFSQAKQAHWNVVGPDFLQLHELFDMLAGEVLEHVDNLAERVTALGGIAEGTVRMGANTTRLPEFPREIESGNQALSELIERFGTVSNSTRTAIKTSAAAGDDVTADLFTEIARALDKNIYFLEQHFRGNA